MLKRTVLSLVATATILSANNQAELNINGDTMEISGDFYLNDSYNVSEDANYYFTASYLDSEVSSSQDQTVLSAGLSIVSQFIDDNGFSFGLSIKAILADSNNKV